MKEKEDYIKKLTKKINKLTKLKNLLLSDEKKSKEINNGRPIPKPVIQKAIPNEHQPLREIVKNKILTSNEFRKEMYKGVRPLNVVMDETYEKYKDLKVFHSDTNESIKENVRPIDLYSFDFINKNINKEVTFNVGEQDTPKRPESFNTPDSLVEKIDKNSLLSDEQLIQMLNEKSESEIKNSLIESFKKGEKVSLGSLLNNFKKPNVQPQNWALNQKYDMLLNMVNEEKTKENEKNN